MIRNSVAGVADIVDPGPALRQTPFIEALQETVRGMWAESNAAYLLSLRAELLQPIKDEYVTATGRPIPEPENLTDFFVDEEGNMVPLTEENWFWNEVSKLSDEERNQVTTRQMFEARFLRDRDIVLRETAARVGEASTTARVTATVAGGLAAGVTDPFTIPFLPFGGFGRAGLTAAQAITRVGLIEGAIGAATAIPGEYIFSSLEERAGRKATYDRMAMNVGLSALGGFAFGAMLEGGVRYGKRVLNNMRANRLERDIAKLREIERETLELTGALQRAGTDFSFERQRKIAADAFEDALRALKNNDIPRMRGQIVFGEDILGTTPKDFSARMRGMYDEADIAKAVTEAEKTGQSLKRSAEQAGRQIEEAAKSVGDAPVSKPLTESAKRTETEIANNAFSNYKSTSNRVSAINDELPGNANIYKNKASPSGYSIRVSRSTGDEISNIKDIQSSRSVAYALRNSGALSAVEETAEAPQQAIPPRGLEERMSESEKYQAIKFEDREAATLVDVDQRYAGREDEKIIMVEDANGNITAKSLNELKKQTQDEEWVIDEFGSCTIG